MKEYLKSKNIVIDYKGILVTIYFLYMLAIILGFLASGIGVIIAYLLRKKAGAVASTHLTFQIRGFWIGVLYFFIAHIIFIAVFAIAIITSGSASINFDIASNLMHLTLLNNGWQLMSYFDISIQPNAAFGLFRFNFIMPFDAFWDTSRIPLQGMFLPFNMGSLGPMSMIFFGWWVVRNARGLYYLLKNKEIPNTNSWFI